MVGWRRIGRLSETSLPGTPKFLNMQNSTATSTHDLDFSAILATTCAKTPSVIQIRTQDVLSEQFRDVLTDALRQFAPELEAGALIAIDETRSRARVLPLI